jgi:hypothetical protein
MRRMVGRVTPVRAARLNCKQNGVQRTARPTSRVCLLRVGRVTPVRAARLNCKQNGAQRTARPTFCMYEMTAVANPIDQLLRTRARAPHAS